jgi:hypothetical protein
MIWKERTAEGRISTFIRNTKKKNCNRKKLKFFAQSVLLLQRVYRAMIHFETQQEKQKKTMKSRKNPKPIDCFFFFPLLSSLGAFVEAEEHNSIHWQVQD